MGFVKVNKDNQFIFGLEKSKRQNWTAQAGINYVGSQSFKLHSLTHEALLVLYLKYGNTCKLIASPIPCKKIIYIFPVYLIKSVRFLQNHVILGNTTKSSVSKLKEIGENNVFLQNYNYSKLNFFYKSVSAETIIISTKQLIKNGVYKKKII